MRTENHILLLVSIGVVSLAIACPNSPTIAADPAFQVPVGQRQLFLDDFGIATIENLERTMHSATKKGAVIRPDPNRPKGALQIRNAPFWIAEANVFRFMIADTAGATSTFRWFNSPDGLHWTPEAQPDMGNYMVLYHPHDPNPARRYKTVKPNHGVAVSPDGIQWSMVPGVASVPTGDEQNLTFDEQNHIYLLTVKRGGPHGRSVGLATSEDFEHWTDHGLIFHADDRDQELGKRRIKAHLADPNLQQPLWNNPSVYNVDVYNMPVFRYEGCYIGMPMMYHAVGQVPNHPNTTGFHQVQVVCSRDLKTWNRVGDRKAFIKPSPKGTGAYDTLQIVPPSNAVVRDDELWFYYSGMKYRGSYGLSEAEQLKLETHYGAINLAVLRRDGFVSLDASDKEGKILTEPFLVPGDKLMVNVDALEGELRAEMLDAEGTVVAKSEPLTGDLLREPVKWSEGDMAELNGQHASLRFTLRNAQFYSYWIE
jgi:hypothetical protein